MVTVRIEGESMTADFSHQDWRDRSFRGQELQQATFEGADVRGCDFRGANLTGVTFKNAKLGRTRRHMILVIMTVTPLVLLAFHAFSHMFFGGLGTIRQDPAWGYVLALQISLALAGGMTALQALWHRSDKLCPHWLRLSTGMLGMMASCALIGFFYGGDWSDNNPKIAIASAVGLGLIGLGIGRGIGPRWLIAGLTMVGAIAAYGFFLTAGTNASTLIHGQKYALGFLWLGISALYLKWTLDTLSFASQRINAAMTTCFDPF